MFAAGTRVTNERVEMRTEPYTYEELGKLNQSLDHQRYEQQCRAEKAEAERDRIKTDNAEKDKLIEKFNSIEVSADGAPQLDSQQFAAIRISFETLRMKAGELQARGDELLAALKVLVDAASVSAIPFPAVLAKAREAIRIWGS